MKSLIVFIILILAVPVIATTYYYDANADGNDNGLSWLNAFPNVALVNANMQGGDTCLFVDTIRGTIYPPSGGTYSDRTAYIAGNGVDDTPTFGGAWLFGGDNLTNANWDDYSGFIDSCSYAPTYEHSRISQAYLVTIDDSLTVPVTSLPGLTSAGQAFHDDVNDILYVWNFDDSDIDGEIIEASAAPPVYLDQSGSGDHTIFWGFVIKYGNHALFEWGYNNYRPDSLFIESCSLMFVSGVTSQNIATIRAVGTNDTDSANNGHWLNVRHCYIDHINHTAWPATAEHYKGISIYAESFVRVDSCEFGEDLGIGLDYKTNLGGAISAGNVARWNLFRGGTWAGMNIYCWGSEDSAYGNIFLGGALGSCQFGIMIESLASLGDHFLANNTFYDCDNAIIVGSSDDTNGDNISKYSVTYVTGAAEQFVCKNADTLTWTIDSNIYYPAAYEDFRTDGAGAGSLTLAQWQSRYSFDLNSTGTLDPDFDDVNESDPWIGFARSGCDTVEVDITYGGMTWNKYGAVQSDAVGTHIGRGFHIGRGTHIGRGD